VAWLVKGEPDMTYDELKNAIKNCQYDVKFSFAKRKKPTDHKFPLYGCGCNKYGYDLKNLFTCHRSYLTPAFIDDIMSDNGKFMVVRIEGNIHYPVYPDELKILFAKHLNEIKHALDYLLVRNDNTDDIYDLNIDDWKKEVKRQHEIADVILNHIRS
jgi:hypothetical protein